MRSQEGLFKWRSYTKYTTSDTNMVKWELSALNKIINQLSHTFLALFIYISCRLGLFPDAAYKVPEQLQE